MTFLIAEFMFLSTRWYKDLSDSSYGEVKWYSMSMIWIKDIVHCTSPSLKTLDTMKKKHSLKECWIDMEMLKQHCYLYVICIRDIVDPCQQTSHAG